MQYSQKYALAAFLKPMEVGTEFNMADWPLHITLADVFAIELNSKLKQQLTNLLSQQSSIKLSVGENTVLGVTKVTLINKNARLENLHNKIIDLLELNGARFNTPEFTRNGFLAHATIQKLEQLHTGDEVEITSVSLVDMFPNSNWQQRRVLGNFNFKQT